ncbi:MAG TPA: glycine cleavage system protein H [Lentisphaeria bacterium]|nr:MAG: hypothetical protein A2X47_14045 [Lentisphaerae bacterium GWF2_38_69]HBM15890.1 glycine cleavage system protein H [Lentisphaeria bacterium]
MQIPKNLLYTIEHAWARKNGNTVVIGITDNLQEMLESIEEVELPHKGDELFIGDNCVSIQHPGGFYDLPAPLTGRVTRVNPAIRTSPELVQTSPYKEGWLFEMEFDDSDELEMLLDQATYIEEAEREL